MRVYALEATGEFSEQDFSQGDFISHDMRIG